jgi:hypothetical protein
VAPITARARTLSRLDLATLRAAVWAVRALRQAERDLSRHGLGGARVIAPPTLPAHAGRGVLAVLRRRPSTCLERALVLQRWEAAHGRPADVVIGVPGRGRDFVAHAWLDSMPDALAGSHHELMRIPVRAD